MSLTRPRCRRGTWSNPTINWRLVMMAIDEPPKASSWLWLWGQISIGAGDELVETALWF